MKKLYVVLLALAVAFSFGADAMAKDGLSVDLGFAYNSNGAGMAETIVKDGEEGQGNGLFGDVVVGENSLLALKDYTHPVLGKLVSSVDDDGQMSGLNTTVRARYDFLNSFFVRLGFTYDMQIMGGDDSFKIANNVGTPGVDGISTYLITKGVAPAASAAWATGLAGGTVTQKWTYGSWSIPVTVGINVPVADGKYNIYAGVGLTYISGFWQLEVKAPAGYIIADADSDGDIDATDLAALGAPNEKVKFESSGIGINWTLGANAQVYDNISIFLEVDSTVAGGMSDSEKLKTNAGKAGFGIDNIYYPVNLSSTFLRFGASYHIGTPWM
jgi:hypothetical protein